MFFAQDTSQYIFCYTSLFHCWQMKNTLKIVSRGITKHLFTDFSGKTHLSKPSIKTKLLPLAVIKCFVLTGLRTSGSV